MHFDDLHRLVQSAAAIRVRARLAPAGGPAEKVFPPTYEGARYAFERRRDNGAEVDCVLLDSVQSQANRAEAALQEAIDRGRIRLPVIHVRFPDDVARDLGPVTSLTAPHRCYDAILRDSTLDGVPFTKSEIGTALSAARPADATALYRHCPTALVFGAWDSHGARGGMGAKFARAVASEIVGIGVSAGVRTSSRIDPLGIRAEVKVAVGDDERQWRLAGDDEKKAKRPSEIGHSNVPPTIGDAGGVTVDRIEQTWVLSLTALRCYRFPGRNGASTGAEDAVRATLASLALAGRALAQEDGLFLRSRAHLVPIPDQVQVEAVAVDGSVEPLDGPDTEGAIELLEQAAAGARDAGLPWHDEPIELEAEARLVELVRRSSALAPKDAET